jgi:Holliday junction resolvasome RuvABC endonuclease subunit
MVSLSSINPKPKRICAIDASTTSLAFAVFDGDRLESCGKIVFSGRTAYEKVSDACKKTNAFFQAFDQIDAIVIEHTVYMNSPKTAADLALVQGALLGAASLTGIKTIRATNPITWQTFIGNGKLTQQEKTMIKDKDPGKSVSWYKTREREFRKQRTISFVNETYNKQIKDNDVADAIGVGHYALQNWNKLG